MSKKLQDRIRRSRELLLNPYAYLNGEGVFDASERTHAQRPGRAVHAPEGPIDTDRLLDGRRRGDRFSKANIEAIAVRLQRELWFRHKALRAGADPQAVDVLDPKAALEFIGFTVGNGTKLEIYEGVGQVSEGIGLLDRANAEVQVSESLAYDVRRFTLAHELGHALLHEGSGLHRDRAIDGSQASRSTDPIEREANTFAVCFLMPEKLVRTAFADRFETNALVLDESTAFALNDGTLASMRKRYPTRRDLSRRLAGADHFGGVEFEALAQYFRVSLETMAIRLEELKLVPEIR